MEIPKNIRQVNQYLHAHGMPPELSLVKGRGYYYFDGGDSASWYSSSVMTPRIDMLTFEQWLNAYKELVPKTREKETFQGPFRLRIRDATPRVKPTKGGSKNRQKLVYPNGYVKYVRYPEQLPKNVMNPMDKQRMEQRQLNMVQQASEVLRIARTILKSGEL